MPLKIKNKKKLIRQYCGYIPTFNFFTLKCIEKQQNYCDFEQPFLRQFLLRRKYSYIYY